MAVDVIAIWASMCPQACSSPLADSYYQGLLFLAVRQFAIHFHQN